MKNKIPTSDHEAQKFLLALGKNLYSLRIGRRLDLETVAKALEIPAALLARIENGEYDCDLLFFMDICEYYRVDPGDVAPHDQILVCNKN